MIRKVLLTGLIIFSISKIYSQDNLNFKFFGFSFHPQGDVNASNMPTKIDANGIAVVNIGAYFGYEKFIYNHKFSLKTISAVYMDCGGLFGGFVHLGFRGVILHLNNFSINGGLGPTLIYRRSWYSKFENYVNSGFFDGTENEFWQYKFLWYGGEFEFNYKLSKSLDFSVTLVPGYPKFVDLSLGVRYRLR